MRSKADLLTEINADLPPGVDWKQGARRYIDACFAKHGRDYMERHSLTKPFNAVPSSNHVPYVTEAVHYLDNFVNAVALLNLPGGAHIMDVGCGGGWLSHFLSRMGYNTFGFDISEDFIDLAKRRITLDSVLKFSHEQTEAMFKVHDIESEPLPEMMRQSFDAIIMESCLHHLVDPIAALSHLAEAVKSDGVLVVIEGENRKGPIKDEYLAVMREYHTLERPYPRDLLCEALTVAGFSHVEFVAPVHGWYSVRDPVSHQLTEVHRHNASAMNIAICGKTEGSLNRLFPWRASDAQVPGAPEQEPTETDISEGRVKRPWVDRLLSFGRLSGER